MPTTRVQRGRVQVTVYTVGDLRASRSVQLAAPPMGGQLQIVQLADTGDARQERATSSSSSTPAEQEFNLEQARFDLQLAEQDIVKADAQAAVQIAEDEVALLHARYDVRRAELDLQSNELVSAIKAQQNVLLLDEARQRLAQIEADVKTHRDDDARRRPTACARSATRRSCRCRSPSATSTACTFARRLTAVVTVRTNFQAFGGIIFSGGGDARLSASATRRSRGSRSPK